MTNTFDSPSLENITIVNITSNSIGNQQQQNETMPPPPVPFHLVADGHIGGSNKVKFSGANNASSITNGFGTMYPPNKNGELTLFKL